MGRISTWTGDGRWNEGWRESSRWGDGEGESRQSVRRGGRGLADCSREVGRDFRERWAPWIPPRLRNGTLILFTGNGNQWCSFLLWVRGVILSELDSRKMSFQPCGRWETPGGRASERLPQCPRPRDRVTLPEGAPGNSKGGGLWAWLGSRHDRVSSLSFMCLLLSQRHSDLWWTLNGGLHTQWAYPAWTEKSESPASLHVLTLPLSSEKPEGQQPDHIIRPLIWSFGLSPGPLVGRVIPGRPLSLRRWRGIWAAVSQYVSFSRGCWARGNLPNLNKWDLGSTPGADANWAWEVPGTAWSRGCCLVAVYKGETAHWADWSVFCLPESSIFTF